MTIRGSRTASASFATFTREADHSIALTDPATGDLLEDRLVVVDGPIEEVWLSGGASRVAEGSLGVEPPSCVSA